MLGDDTAVVLLTQVNYRTGELWDMAATSAQPLSGWWCWHSTDHLDGDDGDWHRHRTASGLPDAAR